MDIKNTHIGNRKKTYSYNTRRQLDKNSSAEPIRYSEIRHMKKHHKQENNGITLVFLDKDSVAFASGVNQGKWMEHDTPNYLLETSRKSTDRLALR